MADLRYRTFRLKTYSRFLPSDLAPEARERYVTLLDRLDEDGIEAFFATLENRAAPAQVLKLLREARAIGDRLNVMDRMLPALPHTEISECYDRLRALGAEIDLLAAETLSMP